MSWRCAVVRPDRACPDAAAATGIGAGHSVCRNRQPLHRLRGQQTTLVLLAEREDLDAQLVTIARHHADAQPVAAGEARLEETRADQMRARAQIATLRVELAILVGVAPSTLDSLPGGSIPLPPKAPVISTRDATLANYRAASVAAHQAQSQAEHARTIAAVQEKRAHAGTLPAGEALVADRQALDALQVEEQARVAMTQAYVALISSLAADQ